MIAFPNCKINLGLHIVNKREDGYHDLETVFYPLPLYDVLEVIQNTNPEQEFELFLSGIKLNGDHDKNLCVKAYRLLKKDFPQLPAIKTYLYKNIPTGAGLGGGSADGAFTLALLNKKFNLALGKEQFFKYALELGSDCPFFIQNIPSFATQRGENLAPVELSLASYKLILVNPGIHINTTWAFSQIKPSSPKENITDIIAQPVESWKHSLTNDFEQPVFSAHPEIEEIKNRLYHNGALYAAMSGSGSSVFGIFERQGMVQRSMFPVHYFIKELTL